MQKRKQILGNPRFQTVPSGWSPATGLGTSLEDVKCNASMPSRGSVARESDCDTHSNVLRQRSSPVLVTVLYLLLNAQSVAARLEVAVSRRYQAHGGSAAFLNTLPSGRVSEPGWTNGQTRVRQRTMRPFLKDSRRIAWSRSMRRHDASRHQGHAFGSRSRSSSLRSISDDCGENGDGGSNDHLPAEVEVHLPADVELDLPTEVEVKVEVEDTSPPVQEEEIVAVAAGASAALEVAELEAEVASFEFAPAMTVHKFQTMQDRRVPVTIKYSGGGGFKRYFEEIAIVLKQRFPDVIIDREIVEMSSTREEEVFEIRIDGKLVCAKRRGKPGVFLHMETFEQAIRKARQRRRPGAIVYGDQETYQNVKALTDERATDNFSLERDFKNLTESGDISQDGRTN